MKEGTGQNCTFTLHRNALIYNVCHLRVSNISRCVVVKAAFVYGKREVVAATNSRRDRVSRIRFFLLP